MADRPTVEWSQNHHETPSEEVDFLQVFLRDYCQTSKDRAISRGYLDGFDLLLINSGNASDLAEAARTVALAAAGKKAARSDYVDKARAQYAKLLVSFHQMLATPVTAGTVEALMIAVLLGLYEVRHVPHCHSTC